jgi:hypothetical protein
MDCCRVELVLLRVEMESDSSIVTGEDNFSPEEDEEEGGERKKEEERNKEVIVLNSC